MKTFEYVGPTAQLVGIGGAENGRVYGVPDELAPILASHEGFKKVTGIADAAVFDVLNPDVELLPAKGKAPAKPRAPKAARKVSNAKTKTTPAAPPDAPPNPATTTPGPAGS